MDIIKSIFFQPNNSQNNSRQFSDILRGVYARGARNNDIHNAARELYDTEQLKAIKILCAKPYNCDIHSRDSFSNTILHAMVASLPSAGGSINPYMNIGLNNIKELITEEKVDVTAKNYFGNTIFHDIVQKGDKFITNQQDERYDINAVKFLLNLAKKDFFHFLQSMKNIDGNDLLHLAAAFGQPITTSILLDKASEGLKKHIPVGKSINTVNHDGLTPLHYAVLGNTLDHVEVVKLLVKNEAIHAKYAVTALKMVLEMIEAGKGTSITKKIKEILEKEVELLDEQEYIKYSEIQPPTLKAVYCTISCGGLRRYPTPQWVPSIECHQRKPKEVAEKSKETKHKETEIFKLDMSEALQRAGVGIHMR